jgi:sugar lactone lactonase YvrE
MDGAAHGSDGSRRDRIVGLVAIVASVAFAAGLGAYLAAAHRRGDAAATGRSGTLRRFRDVDPALVHYREAARVATGMQFVHAIACDAAGRLLVAGDREIRVYEPDGSSRGGFEIGIAPTCVAVDADGTIVVCSRTELQVRSPGGELLAAWSSGDHRTYLTSVAVRGDLIAVADWGSRSVLLYSRSGAMTGRVARRDEASGAEGLVVPSPFMDVAIDAQNALWVADTGRHRLEKYLPDGRMVGHWGRASPDIDGFCGCCNPSHFALTAEGAFVTAEKGIPRVKLYGPDGALVSVVAGPDAFASDAIGLDTAAGPDGRIFVLVPSERAVRVFVRK